MGIVHFQPPLPLPDNAGSTTRSRRAKRGAGPSAAARGSARSPHSAPSARTTGSGRGARLEADGGASRTTSGSSFYGPDEDWRLDEGTRRTGRQGLKCAREVLAEINGRGSQPPGTGRRAAA